MQTKHSSNTFHSMTAIPEIFSNNVGKQWTVYLKLGHTTGIYISLWFPKPSGSAAEQTRMKETSPFKTTAQSESKISSAEMSMIA